MVLARRGSAGDSKRWYACIGRGARCGGAVLTRRRPSPWRRSSSSSASAVRMPGMPSRSARSRASGRATTTSPRRRMLGLAPERLAEHALHPRAGDRTADPPRHGQAESGAVGRSWSPARRSREGTHRARGTGSPSIDPGDRPARTRRSATACAASESARRSGDRSLDREPLAALVATPLQHDPAGTRRHLVAGAVGPGALALLGLVGALHKAVGSARRMCAGGQDSRRRYHARRTSINHRDATRARSAAPAG